MQRHFAWTALAVDRSYCATCFLFEEKKHRCFEDWCRPCWTVYSQPDFIPAMDERQRCKRFVSTRDHLQLYFDAVVHEWLSVQPNLARHTHSKGHCTSLNSRT